MGEWLVPVDLGAPTRDLGAPTTPLQQDLLVPAHHHQPGDALAWLRRDLEASCSLLAVKRRSLVRKLELLARGPGSRYHAYHQAKQRGGNEKNKERTRDQRAREGVIEEQKEDLRMSPRRA